MKLATIAAVRLAAALGLSAGLLSIACHQRAALPVAPAPGTAATEKSSPADPGQPPPAAQSTSHRDALVEAAIQRAEQNLEKAVATWKANGVPQDEITRRARAVRAHIDSARSGNLSGPDGARRDVLMNRFRDATQRAVERRAITAERGAALIEQFNEYLDRKR